MCRSIFTLILMIVLGTGSTAQGQPTPEPLSKTRGLFLNIHANGNYFNSNIGNGTIGGLAGAKLGLSFSSISVFLQSNNAIFKAKDLSSEYKSNDVGFIALGLGGRYHFRTSHSALIPYAEAGFHIQYFTSPEGDEDNALGYGGYGPSIGGGIQYFFSQTLALDVGFNLMYGFYEHTFEKSTGERVDVQSLNTQLNIGFSWYPFNILW